MRLFNIRGKLVDKNVTKYRINWDAPSRSKLQFQVKQFLKPFWLAQIVYEEFPVYGTQLKVDILNATMKIAIEVHGPQHESFHYFHNKNRFVFLEGLGRDASKEEWLELNKFKLVIIYDKEVPNLSKEVFKEKYGILL